VELGDEEKGFSGFSSDHPFTIRRKKKLAVFGSLE
jgi:hypothetical protein